MAPRKGWRQARRVGPLCPIGLRFAPGEATGCIILGEEEVWGCHHVPSRPLSSGEVASPCRSLGEGGGRGRRGPASPLVEVAAFPAPGVRHLFQIAAALPAEAAPSRRA